MRILLMTDWVRLHGGIEAYFTTLRRALAAAGHDVALLTSTAGSAADGTAEYRAFGTERVTAQVGLQLVNPSAVRAVRRAVREFRPDAAVVSMTELHLSPAALMALGAVPSVLAVSDYKQVCPLTTKLRPDGSVCTTPAGVVCRRVGCLGTLHWLREQPRYHLIRRAVAGVARVLVASRWMQRALGDEGIPADVLPLPVPHPAPGFRRRVAEAPCFVAVGRLSREKGIDLLVRAFARDDLAGARLRIVGDGPQRAELERMVDARGLRDRVTFAGWMSPGEVERELVPAWAAVVPSRWAEPFGLVAAEPIVRGVPVVGAAHGGMLDIIEPGVTGLLFRPGDADDLGRQLAEVASGRALGAPLPDATLARVRTTYSPEEHVRRLTGVLEEVRRS